MRPINFDLEMVLNQTSKRIDLKVEVEDADNVMQSMRDFHGHDWIISVDMGDHVDSDCSDTTIVFNRNLFDLSLAPLHKTSILNQDSGGFWNPILFLNHEVRISARYAAGENAEALDYIEIFKGAIDSIDWGKNEVSVQCRDKFRHLQDTFIQEVRTYGDVAGKPIEDVMQDILDDWVNSPTVTLYVPSSPGYNVFEFNSTKQSVADQLILLADQIGWRVKYKWHQATTQFRLTLYEPDRAKVAVDRDFSAVRYYDVQNMSVDISNIRNIIEVNYSDYTDLDSAGIPIRKKEVDEDSASVTLYGERWMGVTEASTSIIDEPSEAANLCAIILADLSTPLVYSTVELPLFAPIEIEDIYYFHANNVHYTDDITFAVIGYRHTFSEGKARTVMTLKEGTPIGRYSSWNSIFAMNGNAPTDDDFVPPGTILVEGTQANIGGITILFTTTGLPLPSTGHGPGKPDTDYSYEVHVTPPGGTPSAGTLVGTTTGKSYTITADQTNLFPVDELMDVHVRILSKFGPGPFSTLSDVKAYQAGSAYLGKDSTAWVDGMHFNFNENTKGTDYVTDGWIMETGTWNTDAKLDDGTTFGGGVTPQYGQKFLLLQ